MQSILTHDKNSSRLVLQSPDPKRSIIQSNPSIQKVIKKGPFKIYVKAYTHTHTHTHKLQRFNVTRG